MINTLSKYLLAGLAACFTALPATARFDPGTYDLLQLVESYGVDVRFNTALCDGSKAGSFKVIKGLPILSLCINPDAITADDHNSVRHEVWHYIQYCNTPGSSTVLHPLLKDRTKYNELIHYGLSGFTIERIRADYPDDHEYVELEAFAAAELLSAKFIGQQVVNHCSPIRTNRPIVGA
jgi:hypothetical protein